MKKTIFLSMKPIDHLEEMNDLLSVLFTIPAVKQYADTHKLVNRLIFKNDCFEIVFNSDETLVYINAECFE